MVKSAQLFNFLRVLIGIFLNMKYLSLPIYHQVSTIVACLLLLIGWRLTIRLLKNLIMTRQRWQCLRRCKIWESRKGNMIVVKNRKDQPASSILEENDTTWKELRMLGRCFRPFWEIWRNLCINSKWQGDLERDWSTDDDLELKRAILHI